LTFDERVVLNHHHHSPLISSSLHSRVTLKPEWCDKIKLVWQALNSGSNFNYGVPIKQAQEEAATRSAHDHGECV